MRPPMQTALPLPETAARMRPRSALMALLRIRRRESGKPECADQERQAEFRAAKPIRPHERADDGTAQESSRVHRVSMTDLQQTIPLLQLYYGLPRAG